MSGYQVSLSEYGYDMGLIPKLLRPLERGNVNNAQILDRDGNPITVSHKVVFDVSPVIGESRSADYVDQGIPGPVGVVVYTVTGNRRFSLSSKFISRTILEADINYKYVNLLRSWLLPMGASNKEDVDKLEAGGFGVVGHPPILRFEGYKQQFYKIPVVITELSISFPEDVDYIEGSLGMVPIIQSVEVSLLESHALWGANLSAEGVREEEFEIQKFREGNLPGY